MRSTIPFIRRGISLIEVLVVVGILGTMFVLVTPRLSSIRERSALRAARQQLTSTFAAARAAALQKGKTATLTLTPTTAVVSVNSGLNGVAVQVLGPLRFNQGLGASVAGVGSSPMTVSFDARGLVTPTPAGISRYRVVSGSYADTVCLSAAGIILPRGCQL